MGLKILTVTVGLLKSNCYFLTDTKSRATLIVDPGDDGEYLESIIQKENFVPKMIIATHGHFDHIMAVTELKLSLKIPFLIARKDLFLVKRMAQSANYYLKVNPGPIPIPDDFISGNKKLTFEKNSIIILNTPGHTPGGVSLYLPKNKIILTGDTLFAKGSVGRTDFKYSNGSALHHSILKILHLPKDTKILPGHGISSNVRIERKYHRLKS